MRRGVAAWVLFALLISAEAIQVTETAASGVQARSQLESVASALWDVASSTAQDYIESRKHIWLSKAPTPQLNSRDDDQTLLELDSSAPILSTWDEHKLVLSNTHTDRFFGGKESTDWINCFRIVNYFLAAVAVAALIGILLGGYGTYTNKRTKGWLGWAFYFTLFSIAVFIAMMCTELFLTNMVLQLMGKSLEEFKNWPQQLADMVKDEITHSSLIGVKAAAAMQHGSMLTSKLSTSAQLKEMQFINTEEPVFCQTTFQDGSLAYNKYPYGSPVHAYNMRRIADAEKTTDSPELDYVRQLLSDPDYKGGVTTEQARLFGAISNECEDFHGEVSQCCDPSQTEAEMQERCPGRVVYEQQNNNYCQCIEVLMRLGFVVEDTLVSHCTFYVRDEVKKFAASSVGADLVISQNRADLQQVYGCAGAYDAKDAVVTGVEKLGYSENSLHSDAAKFGGSSQYTRWTSGLGKVEWAVESCKAGKHTLQFRVSNQNTEKSVRVLVDNQLVQEIAVSGDKTFVDWDTETVIVETTLPAGAHTIALESTSTDSMVQVHRLAVCEDAGLTGCPQMTSSDH